MLATAFCFPLVGALLLPTGAPKPTMQRTVSPIFDPLGLKPTDPAELREMQAKELSHGRLGMLAAAGFLAQEAATGATWGQGDFSFENFVLGPFFKQEAVELARDAMTFTN